MCHAPFPACAARAIVDDLLIMFLSLPLFPLLLRSKSIVDDLRPEWPQMSKKATTPFCVSLAWSADGQTLYSGYTDGQIRIWAVGGSGM